MANENGQSSEMVVSSGGENEEMKAGGVSVAKMSAAVQQ